MKHAIVAAALAGMVVIQSCEKEDPVIPNEEELITTVNFTLISTDNQDTVVMRFKDEDGPGGNPPVVVDGTLMANKTYSGSIELLNELETPPEDITEEVKDEAEEHQFFFVLSTATLGTISYKDQDMNGDPIGLATEWMTQGNASGTLTIILRHEPDKSAQGVSDGDPTNAGGETDIEVTFDVLVQ